MSTQKNKPTNSQTTNSQTTNSPLLSNKTDKGNESAYGLTVKLMVKNLNNSNYDKQALLKELEANNINIKTSKQAITTGLSQTKKIVGLLSEAGFLKL